MNFFFFYNSEDLKNTSTTEGILILVTGGIKQIQLHFPSSRFSEYENKKKLFIINIEGQEKENKIITTKNNYTIYEKFYTIFY